MKLLRVLLFCLATSSILSEQPAVQLPAKEKFHIFLLAGQSNMAGRGKIEPQDKVPHPRVLVLSNEGTWQPAVAPLHYDKSAAGVGLGSAFAVTLAEKYPDITIGLVPAACGGSSIAAWVPGGYHSQTRSHPYDDAVSRTQTALQSGELKGILWHQGESDTGSERAGKHTRELTDLIARFRKEFDNPTLPFVIGQLGQFAERPWNEGRRLVDQAHRTVAHDLPHCAFVPSDGLRPNSDCVHFNTESLREFGRRYAAAYLRCMD